MRVNFANKIKIFLISVLILLVVGMTLFGVLGFNQNIDNKKSYEMQVSVDQIAGESVDVLKTSSNEVLSSLNDSCLDYSYQEMNEGAVLIYKFSYDVSEQITTVKDTVQAALVANNLGGVNAEVKVFENLGSYNSQFKNVILALGISIAIIFVYALFMNKLAGGVAVLCSSVLSALVFLALMAITRIPAQPYLAILVSACVALTSAIAVAITTKYKALYKVDDKPNVKVIAEKVNKSLRTVYIALACGVGVISIVAGAIGLINSVFLGLGILVAGLTSISSAIYMTPCIWTLIKGRRK